MAKETRPKDYPKLKSYIKENGMVKSYQVTALRKYLEDYETRD